MAKKTEAQEMTPAQMRRAAHEAKMSVKKADEATREEFRIYFVELKRKLNLEPEIEHVLWLHLKAIGMNNKDRFNDGVRNFGYKV